MVRSCCSRGCRRSILPSSYADTARRRDLRSNRSDRNLRWFAVAAVAGAVDRSSGVRYYFEAIRPASRWPPTDSFRILLEGDRLVRIGKDVSTIFDLKARTVTVVHPNARTYSVETLDEAQQRLREMLKDWWSSLGGSGKYTTQVQKTGETRQIQGQTAEEYRVIGITLYHGKRVVAGTSVYWTVPNPPSDELEIGRAHV